MTLIDVTSCAHNEDYECFSCFEVRHETWHAQVGTDVDCTVCKLRSVQLSPKATPSKRSTAAPKREAPSWEKGTVRDSRGVPLLGNDYEPIGVKKYSERRHELEARRKRLATDPHVLDQPRS